MNELVKITIPPTRSMRTGIQYAFTDGSVMPNPGVWGWGVILSYEDKQGHISQREFYGGGRSGTNNKAELAGIKHAVSAIIRDNKCLPSEIWTDSQYCVNALTEWGDIWETNQWFTNSGKQVANLNELKVIRVMLRKASYIKLKWIKGHSNHRLNDRADALANMGRINAAKGNYG